MDKLITRLYAVPKAYYEFVDTVVRYAKKSDKNLNDVMNYLDSDNAATTSDILFFLLNREDFVEDSDIDTAKVV